jgi:hypothetical protein
VAVQGSDNVRIDPEEWELLLCSLRCEGWILSALLYGYIWFPTLSLSLFPPLLPPSLSESAALSCMVIIPLSRLAISGFRPSLSILMEESFLTCLFYLS